MIDPLLPNEGTYFDPTIEPDEQRSERQRQTNKLRASEAMLKDLISIFEADVAQLSSIDSIEVDINTSPDEFKKLWYTAQEIKRYAVNKKEYLESLLPD